MESQLNHPHYMKLALRMAARQLGRVAPNPSVGCVIVKDGIVIGRGATADGGRPHAETIALDQVKAQGFSAKGAIAFVSLEPCAHFGKTAPCANALIDAGIKTVYIACLDPDVRVAGKGVALLKAAGIGVEIGLCASEAITLNQGFFLSRTQHRPLVALKMGISLDGKIALKDGTSQWITNAQARHHANFLRSEFDGIMIGAGTLRIDNPRLNCRILGLEDQSPIPIIIGGNLPLPMDAGLLAKGQESLIFYPKNNHHYNGLDKSLKRFPIPNDGFGKIDLRAVLEQLADLGLTRIMVEGGAGLATSLIKAGLVDRLYLYQAARLIGNDGLAGIGDLSLTSLKDQNGFRLIDQIDFDQDSLRIYSKPYDLTLN